MKKLLLTLAAAVIITSSASAVTACGFIEPVNVILELSNNIAKPGSQILRAYRDIVDDYNRARPNNPIKVEVQETPANNIDNEIATGQPLPSLYVAYGDVSAKYETVLNQIDEADKIVDMAQAVNWDPEYVDAIPDTEPQIEFIKEFRDNGTKGNDLTQGKPLDEITHLTEDDPNYEQYHFHPLKDSFSREGSNNDKMYVVPTAKSGMNGIMNTRLINELVKIVTKDEVNLSKQIQENGTAVIRDDGKFFATGRADDWSRVSDIPLNQLTGNWRLPPSNKLRDAEQTINQLFNEWFGGVNSIKDLQAIMQDLSKLEVILMAYMLLVDSSSSRQYFVNHFSMAVDDVPGLIYTMQASLGLGDKQIYSWKNEKPYTLTMYETGEYSESLKSVIELFNWADNLRPLDNNAGNNPDHGYGGLTAKLNTGQYYSDTWQKSGMLAYFGSTAGAAYWSGNPTRENEVQPQDIQLMSAPSYEPVAGSYVAQQGPGMAMFKSKNQLKNEIAIDFLNYFLHSENNTKFAMAASYIPANYYAYYAEQMTGVPTEESQMGPYYKILAADAASNPEKPSIKAAQVVKKYVDSILNDDIQFWTQTPTPFGDAMRFQILAPWFEANFKTVQDHDLRIETFWNDLKNQQSISSIWRVVHGIFPVEGEYEIK